MVGGILQIRLHDSTPPQLRVAWAAELTGALNPHDVGAEIGEHHGCVRTGPHARQFDDPCA
ncbi:hypothetical protein MAV101_09530 [Mycobacterium avium subsp. hominissuis 101]|nr:hypothetical protein MAV101_09530 [Mycobacterium avium subsp. hominissuis 101]